MIYLLVSLDTRCHSYFVFSFNERKTKTSHLYLGGFSGCKYKTLFISNNDFFNCFLKKNKNYC